MLPSYLHEAWSCIDFEHDRKKFSGSAKWPLPYQMLLWAPTDLKNVPFDKLSLLDQNYKFIFCLFLPQCASAHFNTPWLSRVIFQTAIGVNWRVERWICNISDLRPLQSSCVERFLTTNCRDFKSWNHPKICRFFSNTRHTKSWLCYFSKIFTPVHSVNPKLKSQAGPDQQREVVMPRSPSSLPMLISTYPMIQHLERNIPK